MASTKTQFSLRIPKGLHRDLTELAKRNHRPLNSEIELILSLAMERKKIEVRNG